MIKIAICDDIAENVQNNKNIVTKCLKDLNTGFEISTYESSENLLADISDDHIYFDLLLLDIEMPVLDGMKLAKQVKPFLPNIKIIFITSHIEYAIDAYELSIFRYIPKSELMDRLPVAVTDAVKLISLEDDQNLVIHTQRHMEKLPYKDILYIQKDGKYASITTEHGIFRVRKSLSQVKQEIGTCEFIYIDRGCIVNLIHIMGIHDDTVALKNGEQLFMSRGHIQEVKEQINQYWGSHI